MYSFVGAFHIFFVKNVSFALFGKVAKHSFNKFHSLRVAGSAVAVSVPMLKRLVGSVAFLVIGFRCGKLVAHALDGVFIWHRRIYLTLGVDPVFYVMLVSALVMQPRAAHARRSSAYSYR